LLLPSADNWKVCSNPQCPGNPISYFTKDKENKDKNCDTPPWRNGAGVGGSGFIDVGFKGKSPDYECSVGTCMGSCENVTYGVCPTSSCVSNNLGGCTIHITLARPAMSASKYRMRVLALSIRLV
jgi:hypothetical protein